MDIEKFYSDISGDYANTLKRLPSKALIERFVNEFLKDPTFNNLTEGFSENDAEKAFLAAHTLKGISVNLGFSNLEKVSSDLTENLRSRNFDDSSKPLFEKVKEQYNVILDAAKA